MVRKTVSAGEISTLYADAKKCAALIGLAYTESDTPGYGRRRNGKGFAYLDDSQSTLRDNKIKQYIKELVIPPAWQEVWICPSQNGHVLATGMDDKGRKQYIYHPKWRTIRDLIKFYRMSVFAKSLPAIRKSIDTHLNGNTATKEHVLAAMLWILDNTYIRVGNDTYFKQNSSIGLTTLTDKNVIINDTLITLGFTGKSGIEQHITIEHPTVAKIIKSAQAVPGSKLFQFTDASGARQHVNSTDINTYLHEVSGESISAKDFRTWGGTLLAFDHLVQNQQTDKKPDKVIVEAVDTAANVLGNTRSVARSSYVHPHILSSYGTKDFSKYYKQAKSGRMLPGLDTRETELLRFLEVLFTEEFNLLQST